MRSYAPFDRIGLDICMRGQVADVINCTKFYENPCKGFRATGPRKTAFPIDNVHRPYNSVGTTVPHCDICCCITAEVCNLHVCIVVGQHLFYLWYMKNKMPCYRRENRAMPL